jgi:hypothetical protein
MKIKNYPPTQSKFQVSYNDIIPKDEIEYIRDSRIAYVLGCYKVYCDWLVYMLISIHLIC